MKNKTVKVPIELVEALERRNQVMPPGLALLQIYQDYQKLEEIAKDIAKEKEQYRGKSTSRVISEYIDNQKSEVSQIRESINELKTMLQGLQIFFTKVKNEKG